MLQQDVVRPISADGSAAPQPTLVPGLVAATPPFIRIDDLRHKRQFLEFWGIPYVTGSGPHAVDEPAVSFVCGILGDGPENAVVLMPGTGEARLHFTDDGMAFYVSVTPIPEVPPGAQVVSTIRDQRGKIVSFVLHYAKSNTFYVPFSLDEAFDGFQLERYTHNRRFPPDALLRLYYAAKPYFPRSVLLQGRRALARIQGMARFPDWPIDLSLERLRRLVFTLLLRASKSAELPFVWFWPAGKEYCVVLTHDVETGLTGNDGIWRLIGAEKEHGVCSSFNVVPFKYPIDQAVLERLRAEGCEIGVHGYSHDGTLFRDKRRFPRRAEEINATGRDWQAKGFRSASTYREAGMLGLLDFDYDLSFFDTDPYEPQPGGCLSLFPYFIGKLVEIPMTMPQDHTLLTIRTDGGTTVWRTKLQAIQEAKGMACMNTHPDAGYIGDAESVGRYAAFLGEFASDPLAWNPVAGELAQWWRMRRDVRIVAGTGGWSVDGCSDMEVRVARLVEGELAFECQAERDGEKPA